MGKLKSKKYIGLLLIVVLIVGIISLISFGKVDKYSGQVKVKDSSIKTKLLSSTGAILDNNVIRGNSTVEYTVSFTLEELDGVESRTAIIKGSLSDEESRYARFKRIEGTGITSTLSDNGKNIEVQIENVRLGVEKQVKLRLIVENAPNEFTIRPRITVNERTGVENSINVEQITVNTNSISGTVTDQNDLVVSNIEVVVRKDGNEVKRTYTDDNGNYLISDLDAGTYEVDIDEEVYVITNKQSKEVSGNTVLDLKVRAVDPYTIETHKYIESLHLIVDGQERNYQYQDAEKVVEEIKRANSISGEIEYKLVVTNTGEKAGTVARIEDTASEGLRLVEDKNVGWEVSDDKYIYRPIEGASLAPGESREIELILDIENTNEAKTYINKMTAKGELYERVVFILDGELYRETDVLAGDTVEEIIIPSDKFSGWYTDSNMTNKYKFSLPVTKDLILYGEIEAPDCTVTFMDFGNVYDRQTIKCGAKATKPVDPVHPGYRFDKWLDDYDYEFDPDEPIEYDVTYTSKNDLIEYDINYHGLTGAEETALNNPTKYTIESNTITLANPSNRVDGDGDPSEAFIGWTTPEDSNPSMSASIPHGSIGDKDFTANWTPIAPDEYTITYDLDGGTLGEGKSNPNTYTKLTPTFTLNNPSKEGYEFIGWTGTDLEGNTITVTIPTGSRGNRAYVAHYRAIEYNIVYHLEGGALPEGITNPDKYTIESPTITLNNPSKVGHTFIGWTGSNGNTPQVTTTIPSGSTGDKEYTANYEINTYDVIYMDGDTQYAKETVNYGSTATAPSPSPTKEHNIFLAWTLNGVPYVFSTPVTENLTLYSSYEEVLAPTITHTPTEWTNQNVTVTITSDHPEYSYMYNIDGGSYQPYNGPFEVEENCTITAYSVKQDIPSVSVSHIVDNIDKIKPTITALDKTASSYTSITVDLSGYDNESGLRLFNLYINDNPEATFTITSNPNDPQTRTYTFTGLQPSTTYKISVEAQDIATNMSDRFDKNIDTDFLAVCRIIGEDNVLWPEEDYIEFGTLNAAITYPDCESTQCTIQMLQSVNESNEVLQGQDITLDLNGKTVSGVSDYTIRNTGDFTLIDDGNEPGMIYNSTDTAIINEDGGTLTLGVDEDPTDVHTNDPQVIARNTGIYTDDDSTFNYYDGFAQGRVAIQGNVDRTPYLYNAEVTVADNIQTSSLEHLVDAEARIKSVYYTKVHDAIEDSKKGTKEEVTETVSYLQDVKNPSNYGFTYNNGVLVSDNAGIDNTTSIGYMIIDMSEETDAKVLTVDYTISSEVNDYGFGVVQTSASTPNWSTSNYNNIFAVSGESSSTASKLLLPGNVYYLYFGYKKNASVSEGNDNLTINSIKFTSFSEPVDIDFEIINRTKYSYEVEQDGTITATDKDAFNTFEIDLTNETNNKLFRFTPSTTGSGIYYITDGNSQIFYLSVSVNFDSNNTEQCVVLEAGKKYYMTLSNSSGTTSLKNYYLQDYEDFDISNFSIDNDNYNGKFTYNTSTKKVSSTAATGATTNVPTHIYYTFDMTGETQDKIVLLKGYESVSYQDDNGAYIGIWNNNSTSMPLETDTQGRILYQQKSGSSNYLITTTLVAGQVNYIHLVLYSKKTSNMSLEFIKDLGSTTSINPVLFNELYDDYTKTSNNGIEATLTNKYFYNKKSASGSLKFDLTDSDDVYLKVTGEGSNTFYLGTTPFTGSYISPIINGQGYKVYLIPGHQISYLDTSSSAGDPGTVVGVTKFEQISLDETHAKTSYEETKTIARLNQDVDTVEVLKNITLTNPIDIVQERAVILDVNGYTLSNNVDGYMINNNGSLTLTDNKYVQSYQDLVIETEAKKQELQELYDEYKDMTAATLDDYVQDDLYIQYDAYYGNGGQSGVQIADVKGNNQDVSFAGNVYSDAGYMELYSYFNVASSNRLNLGGSFTVDTAFNKRGTGYSHYLLTISGYFGTYSLYVPMDGAYYMYGPAMSDVSFGVIDTNIVQHMSFVYDEENLTVKFYINGVCRFTKKLDSPLDTSSTTVSLQGASLPIDVYNLSIYKKPLSQMEVAQNYYVNLARYANRTNLNQSRKVIPTDGENITDGDMETYFESDSTQSFSYFLPNPVSIKRVKFYFDKDNLPEGVTLIASTNNQSSNETILTKSSADIDSNGVLEATFDNSIPYVRITLNLSSSGSAYKLYEMEYELEGQEMKPIIPEMDTSILDKKKFTTNQQYLVYNAEGAVLNVNNVTLENVATTNSYSVVDNYGTVVVGKEGNLVCARCTGVINRETGIVEFDEGKIDAYNGIDNYSLVQTSLDGANINTGNIAIKHNVDKDYTINNSKITATSNNKKAIDNANITLYINNSDIFDGSKVGSISPKIIASNSNIYATCNDIYLSNNSYFYTSTSSFNNFEIYDSTFYSTSTSASTERGGKFAIENSKLIAGYSDHYINVESSNGGYIKNSYLDGGCVYARGDRDVPDFIVEDSTLICKTRYYSALKNGGNRVILKGNNNVTSIDNNYNMQIDGNLTVESNIKNTGRKDSYYPNNGMYVTGNVVFSTGSSAYFDNQGYLEFSGNSSIRSTSKLSNPAIVQSTTYSDIEVKFLDNFEIKTNTFSNAVSSGKVTIGSKDGDVHMTPILRAYGMTLSTGNVYFYDGTIIGPRNSTYGTIIEIEDGYDLKKEYDENDVEYVTLSNEPTGDVAQIGDVKYTSLQAAFNDVPHDGTLTTIEIIGNISTSMKATLAADQNVEININDYLIQTSAYPYITNNGTMTISNQGSTKSLTTNIINKGTMTLDDVKINGTGGRDGVRNLPGSTLYVNNGSYIDMYAARTTTDASDDRGGAGTIYVNNSRVKNIYSGTAYLTDSTSTTVDCQLFALRSTITDATVDGRSTIEDSTVTNITNNSNLTITNSTITDITNTSVVTINGGTVTTIDSSEQHYNFNKTVTLNNNVVITCNNKCIKSMGTLNIRSATITSTDTDSIPIVVIDTRSSVINIGTKGDLTEQQELNVSITDPMIQGEKYAIENFTFDQYGLKEAEGTINFYDGVVKAKGTGEPIDGTIAEVETGYSIVHDYSGGYSKIYLDYVPVARIESTGHLYYDLKEAFDAVNTSDDTITLLKRLELVSSYPTITIAAGKKFTFNLNGHELLHNNDNWIVNNGDLTITDETSEHVTKLGKINSYSSHDYINNGTLTYNGVNEIYNDSTEITNDGTLSFNNSELRYVKLSNASQARSAFDDEDELVKTTKLAMTNNGTLSSTSSLFTNVNIYNAQNTTTTFNSTDYICFDSIFNSCIDNSGDMTITSGNYSQYGTFTYSRIRGGWVLLGGLITNTSTGTLAINNPNMNISEYIVNSEGNTTITGGTYYIIYTSYSLAREIPQGAIMGNAVVNGGTYYGVDFDAGNITVLDGTFNNTRVYIEGLNGENGSFTLGQKDGVVSTTSPSLYNNNKTVIDNQYNKTFNFYDGVVSGPNNSVDRYGNVLKPIVGVVTEIETGYTLTKDISGGQQSRYLTDNALVELSSNGQGYISLGDALNDATTGDTITYLRDSTLTLSDPVTNVTKDVTIDLNGKTIDSAVPYINNSADITLRNGTIEFYDTATSGIDNTGNINLEGITSNNTVTNDSTMTMSGVSLATLVNNGTITTSGNTTNSINNFTNNGTITGSYINAEVVRNYGSIDISNSTLSEAYSYSGSNVIISDSVVTNGDFADITATNLTNSSISVSGTATIDNLSGDLTNRSNNITITNSTFNLTNTGTISIDNTNTVGTVNNSGTATITSTSVGAITNNNAGTLTLDGCTTTGAISNSGTINFDQTTTTGKLSNSGVFNMSSGSISTTDDKAITNNGELYIESGTVTSTNNTGIDNNGKLVLGTRDGSVDTTDPSINGTVGISGNVTAFYDGIVTGTTESITGIAVVVEDDYELKKEEDQGLYKAYLIQTAEGHARVAVVNNINYTSLQAAIDACANTTCDIILYANIELTEPVTVQAGANISVYLNYRTISPESYVINHSGTGTIRIVSGIPDGIAGAIYKFFADITGMELNPHNIIAYQMEDGNKLLTEETYKLYKLMDGAYKIVKFDEDEIGEYTVGNSKEIMNVIKGRLYLNGLGNGEYKLVSNTNRELDFEISDTGISSNIRINTSATSGKVVSSSIATLILAFGTGIIRVPYILILVVIALAVTGLLILKSKKSQKKA